MNQAKHICMLTSVHSPLDVRIFEKEARALHRRGYRVSVIGPADGTDHEVDGIEVRTVTRARGRMGRLKTIRRIYSRALEIGADCYHFHDPELIPLGVLLRRRSGAATVYDVHEFLELDVACKTWIPEPLRRPLSRVAGAVERWGSARVTGIVSALDERAEVLRTLNPLTTTVHNYCPSDLMASAVMPEASLSPSIVYLGVINRRRGLVTVLRAMEAVHRSNPEIVCYLLGDVEEIESLEAQDRARLRHVQILGKLPYARALGYLAAADMAWLPWTLTPYNALGLPNKLMEYMAAGKPVVASKVGRIADIIRSADCGLIVEPLDSDAHARAILSLAEEPSRAELLGKNARQAFLSHYNWDTEVELLYDFYERLWSANG